MWQSILISALVLCTPMFARTLNVPGDFAIPSAALDSARTGDTVLVHPGTYSDRVIFPPRDIVLISEFFTSGDSSAIARTTIDASAFAQSDTASVISFFGGNTRATFVGGLTLTGGHGLHSMSGDTADHRHYGCGVSMTNCNPTIHSCRITGNTCTNFVGLNCEASSPRIAYCDISNNCGEDGVVLLTGNQLEDPSVFEWNDVHGNYGCGTFGTYLHDNSLIANYANVIVRYNHFHDYDGWEALGVEAYRSYLQLQGNVFERITSDYGGNVVASIDFGNTYRDNIFRDISTHWDCMDLQVTSPHRPIMRSLVERNWFENISISPIDGGPSALWFGNPQADVRNNVFLHCTGSNGAVQFSQMLPYGCDVVFEGNHFFYNQANGPYHHISAFSSAGAGPGCAFHDNWFEGNMGSAIGIVPGQLVTLDVSGNFWGDSTGPYDPVLNPNGRGDTLGTNVICTSWLTAPPGTSSVPNERLRLKPDDWNVSLPFPNPFNATTRIHLETAKLQPFNVTVYDLMGRQVARVWRGVVLKNTPTDISWDGKDERGVSAASGIYYIVVRPTGPFAARPKTMKAVLLR